MPHIAIYIENTTLSGTDLVVSGHARVNVQNSSQIHWDVTVSFSALSSTINTAIRDAAIAAAAEEDHIVGALDKKTLFGGAVGI